MDKVTDAHGSIAVEGNYEFLLENTYLNAEGLKHSSSMIHINTANKSNVEKGSYPKLNVIYGKDGPDTYPAYLKTIPFTNQAATRVICVMAKHPTMVHASCDLREEAFIARTMVLMGISAGERFPHQLSFSSQVSKLFVYHVGQPQAMRQIQLHCCQRPRCSRRRACVIRDISERTINAVFVQAVSICLRVVLQVQQNVSHALLGCTVAQVQSSVPSVQLVDGPMSHSYQRGGGPCILT